MSSSIKPVLVLRKWISSSLMAPWINSLSLNVSQRIIAFEEIKRKFIRLEIYPKNKKEAARLKGIFGGRLLELSPKVWWKPQQEKTLPLKIGQKLLIVTHAKQAKYWQKKFPLRGVVVIPQGLAFGSGQHATTRMCLQTLSHFAPFNSFFDIGTGTGILSLAAAKLGCSTIDAIDNDPTAIRVAKENSLLNKVKISFKTSSVSRISTKRHYEIVMANLYSELLIQNAEKISSYLKKGGKLILSGIRCEQKRKVKMAYAHLHLILEKSVLGWCCLIFEDKSS
jgi:ribosomal protein L11 methyltransferase